MEPLVVNDRIVIPIRDLEWTAVRSSGPGGQNVNKVASKVELRFEIATCEAFSEGVRTRLYGLCRNRMDAEGRVLITSQLTRDQPQNLEDARQKLRELILRALIAPKVRRPTKPTRGSQKRRLESKKRQSSKKESRGRVAPEE